MTQWYLEISTKKSILQKIKVEPCMKLHCFRCHDTNPPFGLKEVYAVNVNIGTLLKGFRRPLPAVMGMSKKIQSSMQVWKATLLKRGWKETPAWHGWKKNDLKKNIRKNQKSIYQMMSNLEIHGFKLQFGALIQGGSTPLLKHQVFQGMQRCNQPKVTP